MTKFISIILTIAICLVIGGAIANAQGLQGAKTNLQKGGEKAYGESVESNLSVVVGNVVRGVLVITGILLTILLVWGGANYMTAGGDSGKLDKAKDRIRNAIIGLVIVLLAYSISAYVMGYLIQASTSGS